MISPENKKGQEPSAQSASSHAKHANLSKPLVGEYHRNEWAILGTPCADIRSLACGLTSALGATWQLAYLDADHKGEESEAGAAASSVLKHEARTELTDKITFFRTDTRAEPNSFQKKALLNSLDAVIVNGNHFTATRQVVVIDPRKDLSKKIDRLTNVVMVLLAEGQTEVPDIVKSLINRNTPVFSISDHARISAWFQQEMQQSVAIPKGLILAGGKSSRMQIDKGLIFYHDLPQREYLYKMIAEMGIQPHLSLRADQVGASPADLRVVTDTFEGLGPFGALLSAFRSDPNSAWLSVACDLPLLQEKHLQQLLSQRNPSKIATAFLNPDSGFPEPLITLWEPKAYPVLLQFLALGYSCPRKVLINNDVEIIKADDPAFLLNANTPEDRERANTLLAGSK